LPPDQEFQRLISGGAELAIRLSETELLARLIGGESSLAVRDKTLMLTALLKEQGDMAASQGQIERQHYILFKRTAPAARGFGARRRR
jgi:hypothetical protein